MMQSNKITKINLILTNIIPMDIITYHFININVIHKYNRHNNVKKKNKAINTIIFTSKMY